ncbi:unnamed protein product [Hermetia illucens]|nr:unnamed protein product [Hermetia illucens]
MKYWAVLLVAWLNSLLVYCATDKIVCYYGSWAYYRQGIGKVAPTDLNAKLCTHIIYTFVGLNEAAEVKLLDPWLDISLGGIKNTVALKQVNPNLKVLVAIGGWNQGGARFSIVAGSPSLRKRFAQNAVNFIKEYKFDGMDIDWEYPAGNGGLPQDKANFVLFLQELRSAFDQNKYILSAAVGGARARREESYDVPNLNKYLHLIHVMAYDLHGSWDGKTGANAPLYAGPGDNPDLNVDVIIQQWIQAGASPDKLILGMGFYGRSFTLANANNHGIGAQTLGPGIPGPITRASGSLSYTEICSNIKAGWTVVYDNKQQIPYAFQGNQWVGYDNIQSLEKKVDYAKTKGLGGVMVWSLDQDDIRNVCGGGSWTLLATINRKLRLTYLRYMIVMLDVAYSPPENNYLPFA